MTVKTHIKPLDCTILGAHWKRIKFPAHRAQVRNFVYIIRFAAHESLDSSLRRRIPQKVSCDDERSGLDISFDSLLLLKKEDASDLLCMNHLRHRDERSLQRHFHLITHSVNASHAILRPSYVRSHTIQDRWRCLGHLVASGTFGLPTPEVP